MACEFLYNEIQSVALNNPILFRTSIPCTKNYVYHDGETGNFILKGVVNNNSCFAQYQVTFNGNIALPEDATEIVPIAVALVLNGEARLTSRAIFTPQAVNEYGNVTATAIIKVPKCCCFNLGVEAVPATADPTITPAPIINVQNSNLTIERIA